MLLLLCQLLRLLLYEAQHLHMHRLELAAPWQIYSRNLPPRQQLLLLNLHLQQPRNLLIPSVPPLPRLTRLAEVSI